MAAKGGTNMQIEWCTVRTPVMIAATGLAALLFSLQMRSTQRGIVERYAGRWGVDRALAGRIYAPARFTLSRALLMFWALPVLLLLFSLIGLLAGLTPVFNACPALPFSRFMPVVMTGFKKAPEFGDEFDAAGWSGGEAAPPAGDEDAPPAGGFAAGLGVPGEPELEDGPAAGALGGGPAVGGGPAPSGGPALGGGGELAGGAVTGTGLTFG